MASRGHLCYLGKLQAHADWVTSIATSEAGGILSASRDKNIFSWEISRDPSSGFLTGDPKRSLVGHSHVVQEVCMTSDGRYGVSGSWDTSIRCWDVASGQSTNRFLGHTREVTSVAVSPDNNQIVSASRDKQLKTWDWLGHCTSTTSRGAHSDWISCVRFSANPQLPLILSVGWDKVLKVWSAKLHWLMDLCGHTNHISGFAVSPNGCICASAGPDGKIMLWDLHGGVSVLGFETSCHVNSLEFCPTRNWLSAGTETSVMIWDLRSKAVVADLVTELANQPSQKLVQSECTAVRWSADGSTLFAGYTDNAIRLWGCGA